MKGSSGSGIVRLALTDFVDPSSAVYRPVSVSVTLSGCVLQASAAVCAGEVPDLSWLKGPSDASFSPVSALTDALTVISSAELSATW